MQKTVRTAAMGIIIGLAITSQAQSHFSSAAYLSSDKMKFQKAPRISTISKNTTAAQNTARLEVLDDDEALKTFDLSLNMRIRNQSVQDDNIKASTSGTSFGVDMTWNFAQWLYSTLDAQAYFTSGQSAAIYGYEGGPSSGIKVSEGSVTIKPFKNLSLSTGLLKAKFNDISSVFRGEDGFSGFRQVLDYKNGIFETSLIAHQVVPSQAGTANRVIDDEKDSSLLITNFNLGLVGVEGAFKLSYTKYDFYNMTSALATSSRYMGNTMIGDGSGKYVYYQYKFHGQELAMLAQVNTRLDDRLVVSGSFVQNEDAPTKRNIGWQSSGQYTYNFGNYAIEPVYKRFRYEPDVIPALYSHRTLGYMNRDGHAVEIGGFLKKYNVEAYVQYVDAKEVEPQLTQSDRTGYGFGLEVKYDIL